MFTRCEANPSLGWHWEMSALQTRRMVHTQEAPLPHPSSTLS